MTPALTACNDDDLTCGGAKSTVRSTVPGGAGLHILYVDTFDDTDNGMAERAGAYTVSGTRP